MGGCDTRRARLWRWGTRLGVAACLLGLAGALGLVLGLPWIAEQVLARELARRGAGNVTLAVRALSLHEAVLGPVVIAEGDGLLWVESVVVRYDLRRLREGAVDEIRLTGARLALARCGNDWVPIGLETLERLAAGPGTAATTGPARFQAMVVLRDSRAELRLPGDEAPLVVPLEGTARLALPGESRLQGTVTLQGDRVGVRATLDLATGDGRVSLECGRLDAAAWVRMAPRAGLQLPDSAGELAGWASFRAEVPLRGWTLDGLTGEGTATDLVLCREPVTLRLRQGLAYLVAGAGLKGLRVEFSGETDGIRWSGLEVEPVSGNGVWDGETVVAAFEDVVWRAGNGAQGRVSGHVTASGLGVLESAALELWATVTDLRAGPHGPLAGTLRLRGSLEDLRLDACLEADQPETACGLSALVLDAQVRRGQATEAEVAATAVVSPSLLAQASGSGVRVVAGPLPVSLAAAVRSTDAGLWEGSGTVSVPPRRIEVLTTAFQAAADAGLECRLSARGPAAAGGLAGWECSGSVSAAARAMALEAGTARASGDAAVEARLALDATGLTASGQLDAAHLDALANGIRLAAGQVALHLDSLRCPGLALGGERGWPAWPEVAQGLEVDARAGLRIGAVSLPEYGLECAGVEMDLPFAWDPRNGLHERPGMPPGAGGLRTGRTALREVVADGFTGSIGLAGQAVRIRGHVDGAAPDVTVDIDQTIAWADGLSVALHYVVPPFPVDGQAPWCRAVLADLGGLTASGTVSAEGDVLLQGGCLRLPCRVHLADGVLDWPGKKLRVEGLQTDLELADLLQARTAPFQEVAFTTARMGDLRVDGGRIVLQLDGPHSLGLQRCELNWCGGQIHTEATQFDPGRPDIDLVLYAENVQLVEVLNLIKGTSGHGKGVLSGKLPISYRNGRLSYSRGYLHSIPGEEGWLNLSVGGVLTSAVGPDHPAYSELRRAEKALEDFRVDLFRLDFTGKQAGEPGATILLVGEGAQEKVPVKLNLNVNGAIEDALNVGLRLGGM